MPPFLPRLAVSRPTSSERYSSPRSQNWPPVSSGNPDDFNPERIILAVIPVMAVVVTVVFLLIHLIPGDPVSVMLGRNCARAFSTLALAAARLASALRMSGRCASNSDGSPGVTRG